MLTDKEIKKKYALIFPKNPDKYYPTEYLKSMGFNRGQCSKCGRYFWNQDKKKEICGDVSCTGKFTFLEKKLTKKTLTYQQMWETFSKHLQKYSYTPIKRYPVVARWRNDLYFVEASIDDFIPYVVNGVVQPPANPLTVPQFCLRFNDIGNVGITGSHYTGFVMIGQHRFEKPENYNTNEYLKHLSTYFFDVLGLNPKDLTYHEDVWAGSGNFGPSMELFSGGIELCNQVYMQYHYTGSTPEYEDLKLKVVDMGLGQERVAWFTNRAPISYESTYSQVLKKLKKATGITVDERITHKFYPLAGRLNLDEVQNIDDAWNSVSAELGIQVDKLKKTILPLQALYSIADHTRSLLFALSDGALPSNSGGGYNLRVIYRRAHDFVKKYNWNINLGDVAEWHASALKEQYPELQEHINDVRKILVVEAEKYEKTLENVQKIIKGLKGEVTEQKMIELYDSNGVTPHSLKQAGINIEVPEDFYSKIAERHRRTEERKEEKILGLETLPKTERLYYEDYKKDSFTGKILKTIGDYLILDKTIFYPTSGGQIHDIGRINEERVTEVIVQDGVILHKVENPKKFKDGETVKGKIDKERRIQLAQHHTSVHIINGSARKILGTHVWQGGSAKTPEKARLDISHYEALTHEQTEKIEEEANRIVKKKIKVDKFVLEKNEAEQEYGFILYQGGAIPGSHLRIIKIGNFDVEACGGTHLDNTREAELIKIINTSKIQDGIVRIELKAGNAAKKYFREITEETNKICKMLGCNYKQLPERVEQLFTTWKRAKKGKDEAYEIGKYVPEEPKDYKEMHEIEKALEQASNIVRVQKEQLHRTAERFLRDLKAKGAIK